jgi:hypothetical protein
MISYNTSFHRTIKMSPFALTFGMEPQLPALPTPDLRRKFYGESTTDDLICKLLLTRDIARRNSEVASDEAEKQFNKKAEPHAFLPDQLVLLDEHSFLAKNQKLAPKWSGPHKILRLKGDCNVELLLQHNNKKLITHMNRLKPYFVKLPAAVSSPDFFPAQKEATTPPAPTQKETQFEKCFPYQDELFDKEVNNSDPSPSPRNYSHPHRTTSSSSSAYDDMPEITRTDPSTLHQLTYHCP